MYEFVFLPMSFINDTIDDVADAIIADHIMYKIEQDFDKELAIIQNPNASQIEKSRASKKIYNDLMNDDDIQDNVFEQLDNALTYYSDQNKVIAEYGLNDAIALYQDILGGELPKNNPAGALAFTVLEDEFNKKYNAEKLIKQALSLRASKHVKKLSGKKVSKFVKNPKNPITRAQFKRMVYGTRKRSGRITVKRTIGKKPARVSTKRMF